MDFNIRHDEKKWLRFIFLDETLRFVCKPDGQIFNNDGLFNHIKIPH